jgi:hypothetical protein
VALFDVTAQVLERLAATNRYLQLGGTQADEQAPQLSAALLSTPSSSAAER